MSVKSNNSDVDRSLTNVALEVLEQVPWVRTVPLFGSTASYCDVFVVNSNDVSVFCLICSDGGHVDVFRFTADSDAVTRILAGVYIDEATDVALRWILNGLMGGLQGRKDCAQPLLSLSGSSLGFMVTLCGSGKGGKDERTSLPMTPCANIADLSPLLIAQQQLVKAGWRQLHGLKQHSGLASLPLSDESPYGSSSSSSSSGPQARAGGSAAGAGPSPSRPHSAPAGVALPAPQIQGGKVTLGSHAGKRPRTTLK